VTPRRPLLRFLAVLFAVATILYSALWMYYIRWEPKAMVGIEYEPDLFARPPRITRVVEGSGAAAAGVRIGDVIRAIDGRAPEGIEPLGAALSHARPGDVVRLTVDRAGEAAPRVLPVTMGPRAPDPAPGSLARTIATQLVGSFPLAFLAVGLVVLFARLEDRNAWLLALVFAGFIAAAPILRLEGVIDPRLRGFVLAYKIVFYGLWGALFNYFFAVFPASSWLDRRRPWLKTLLLASAAAVIVPLGLAVLWAGSSRPLFRFLRWLDPSTVPVALRVYFFGSHGLALVSLISNALRPSNPEARRKTAVLLWGTVAAVTPFFLLMAASIYAGKSPYEFPFWVWAPCVLAVLLLPASFAYAVVKHRVLEIPVLLRRSARYLLVKRGVAIMIVLWGVVNTALFALGFTHFVRVDTRVAVAAGAGFGLLLVGILAPALRKTTERIDRAFFRSAYDARRILESLAQEIRTAGSRDALAALLKSEIAQALHPVSVAVYFEGRDGRLSGDGGPESLPPVSHLQELARRGEPLDVARAGDGLAPTPAAGPECLVPMLGRDGRLVGLAALGPRLSEEPYSRDDKRLLVSVASQAGIALDSLRMAEEIAERTEAERRAAVELEVARGVQSRLLPQRAPAIATLECAGACLPARVVGGDYYDFVELGGGEFGLVLADIAGKGIGAALLMANLQASLRSQSALAREDLPRLLRGVNHALFESSAESRFATLFFGCYQAESRRLRYVNCGHDPPILLRADGRIERLVATATVLGAFEPWDSATAEATLEPGDTLVLYSDGITEATNEGREEFGEARLTEALRRHCRLDAAALLAALLETVQAFSREKPEDDITLVVGRCR